MNTNTVTGDLIAINLRQLGAIITDISSTTYQVEFRLDNNLNISYIYNITTQDKYFLQRIKPYPIAHGKFADELEIVDFITKDINKFKNATNSKNFQTFLRVTKNVSLMMDLIEDLFLNYNVDGNDILEFDKDINKVMAEIDLIRQKSRDL